MLRLRLAALSVTVWWLQTVQDSAPGRGGALHSRRGKEKPADEGVDGKN
jgi:hypothetical protein